MAEGFFSVLKSLDAGWFNGINHGLQNSFFDMIMPLLSNAGNGGLIWIVIGLLLFVFGRPETKQAVLLATVALFVSFLVGEVSLKHLFHRLRPFETLPGVRLLVAPLHSFSFPSGHAANAFAAGLVLARKIPGLALPALSLAVAIAFSRVYVGVHYPLDILAGALLGAVCALLVLKYQTIILHTGRKIKPPYIP